MFIGFSCGVRGRQVQLSSVTDAPDILNVQLQLFDETLRKLKVKRHIHDVLIIRNEQVGVKMPLAVSYRCARWSQSLCTDYYRLNY